MKLLQRLKRVASPYAECPLPEIIPSELREQLQDSGNQRINKSSLCLDELQYSIDPPKVSVIKENKLHQDFVLGFSTFTDKFNPYQNEDELIETKKSLPSEIDHNIVYDNQDNLSVSDQFVNLSEDNGNHRLQSFRIPIDLSKLTQDRSTPFDTKFSEYLDSNTSEIDQLPLSSKQKSGSVKSYPDQGAFSKDLEDTAINQDIFLDSNSKLVYGGLSLKEKYGTEREQYRLKKSPRKQIIKRKEIRLNDQEKVIIGSNVPRSLADHDDIIERDNYLYSYNEQLNDRSRYKTIQFTDKSQSRILESDKKCVLESYSDCEGENTKCDQKIIKGEISSFNENNYYLRNQASSSCNYHPGKNL